MGRRRLVRGQALLHVAGVQELPDAHPGPPLQVQGVHALPRLRGRPSHPCRAAMEDRHGEALPARRDDAPHRRLPLLLRGPGAARTHGRGDRAPALRDQDPFALSCRRGPWLPHARPAVAHVERRGGAADQPHHGPRHLTGQRAFRAGRATSYSSGSFPRSSRAHGRSPRSI